MSRVELDGLLADRRTNAFASWAIVVTICVVGIGTLAAGRPLWTVFAVALFVLAVLPPVTFRSWLVMLPWEVLLLAAFPMFGLAVDADRLVGHFASYLSVAAVALVLAVELQAFTRVRMTSGFAVVFVAVTTMAAAALWALLRWGLAGLFDVPFPTDNDGVMQEFVYSTVVGLGAGAIFEAYFRRLGRLEPDLLDTSSTEHEVNDG